MNIKKNDLILIAPDSFKGSLSSIDAAECIKRGFANAGFSNMVCVPMADGGEGTVDALVAATGGTMIHQQVTGPLGEPVGAFYGILGDKITAVIEMAAAAGLHLVPQDKKNPYVTTTYGVGELIKDAVTRGCENIIIGIGGSATNDGGSGMAKALGVRFFDANGALLEEGGLALENLARIDASNINIDVSALDIKVACDVTNPLCGAQGASAVYGPQKGATKEMVGRLDNALGNYADVIKKDMDINIMDMPGAGAAGGLGAGLHVFLNAKLESGVDMVMEAARIDRLAKSAALIITGEGQTDHQTKYGKVPAGLARIAKSHGIALICISGGLGETYSELYDIGVTACFSICQRPMSLESAIRNASKLLENTAESIARVL